MAAAAPIVAAIAASTTATTIVVSIGISLVMAGLTRLLMPPEDLAGEMAARQELIRSPVGVHRVIYGQIRVSGQLVYAESYNKNLKTLSQIIVLASHECDEIGTVWLDEFEVPLQVDDETPVIGNRFFDSFMIYKHLGTADQTVDAELLANSSGSWTVSHRLRGRAYIHTKMQFRPKVYPTGRPVPRLLVKGKKVLDTRTSTTAYSANPALCLYDYLTTYLKYDPATELDVASFNAAADVCDEIVTRKDLTTEPRYECHGSFKLDEEPSDVIEKILTSMAGALIYTGGQFVCHAGAPAASSMTIDEDDLRGPITVNPILSARDGFNGVKGVFADERNLYQPGDFPLITDAGLIAEDNGIERVRDIELPFTTSFTAAQRIGAIALKRARQPMTVSMPCKLTVLGVRVWDTVDVNNATFGWSPKKFRVTDWTFSKDMGIDLELREETDEMWSYDAATDELVHDPSPATTLPNPFDQDPPQNVVVAEDTVQDADGKDIGRLKITWEKPDDIGFIRHYEVRWRRVGDPDWSQVAVVDEEQFKYIVAPIKISDDFEGAVRAVNQINVPSVYVTDTSGATTGDTTPPGVPTAFSVAPGIRSFRVVWTNPTDPDFSHVEILNNTTGTTPTDAEIRRTPGGLPGAKQQWSWGEVSPTNRYFWLRAVDISGNKSALTARQGPFTARNVINSDVANDAISTPNIQDNAASVRAGAASDVTIAVGSNYVVIATTANFTSTGVTRFIWFSFSTSTSAADKMDVRLLRSGVVVKTWVQLQINGSGKQFITLAYQDTAGGSGTRNYSLQVRANNLAHTIGDRVITVLEGKK